MAIVLTIIVPVYNVESFLGDALLSLSLDDTCSYEVLLINDGSTDSSLDICRTFAALHSQVIVIDQSNNGYGSACNVGLDQARGEYVAIFEPDDLLGKDFYATLLEASKPNKPDIVRYNGFHTIDEGVYGTRSAKFKSYCGRMLNKDEVQPLWTSHPCIWNGIYRRQMLMDAQAKFTEGPGASFQDAQFLISLYYSCRNVMFVDAKGYYYRLHANQSVSTADSKVDAVLANMKQQLAWFQSRRFDDATYLVYNSFNQFDALYRNRVRTAVAKRKLLVGFRELQRVYGIHRLAYPGAPKRLRNLYRLLPVYEQALRYFRLQDKVWRQIKKFKSRW